MVDERIVRSSNGVHALRPVILTRVELLGETWPIELTLASRDAMGFRMLLGRQAVRGRFLIDPGRSYLAGRPGRQPLVVTARSWSCPASASSGAAARVHLVPNRRSPASPRPGRM